MLPPNLYARVRISTTHCTRDLGCGAHPVFPAPSKFLEGKRDANLGQNMSRDRELTSLPILRGAPDTGHCRARETFGTQVPMGHNPPACLDFRHPDFPLVTKS